MTTTHRMLLLAVAASAAACAAMAQDAEAPFGGPEDTAFAGDLWNALERERMVGEDAILTMPYEGADPHGTMLGYLEAQVTVAGRSATAIVKRNYSGDGADDALAEAIMRDRRAHLASITVMYRRASGYDPDNANWFWAKYAPDGSPTTTPDGRAQAGRVAKGRDTGCIACHGDAPGGDYVFSYDLPE